MLEKNRSIYSENDFLSQNYSRKFHRIYEILYSLYFVEFPAVTICSLNKYKKSLVEKQPGAEMYLKAMYQTKNLTVLNNPDVLKQLAHIDIKELVERNIGDVRDFKS